MVEFGEGRKSHSLAEKHETHTYTQKLARLKRRHEVENLYLQGLSQHAIAAKYNVDRSQISRDLKWIQEWWFANTDFEIKKHKIGTVAERRVEKKTTVAASQPGLIS